ncbi:tyrosine-protein phosphatase, partial [Streptomyces pharetrae]
MDRHIPFAGLHNFRDLGGYTTTDGRRVRAG